MNAVASQAIAAAASMRLSNLKSNAQKSDFNSVLQKTSEDATLTEKKAAQDARTEYNTADNDRQIADKPADAAEAADKQSISGREVERKTPKAAESPSKDEAEVEPEKTDAELTARLAEVFGISEEALNQIMASFNLTIQQLSTPEGFQSFVNQALSITGNAELLLDSEKFEQFKALRTLIQALGDDLQAKTSDGQTLMEDMPEVSQQLVDSEGKASAETQADDSIIETDGSTSVGEVSIEDFRSGSLRAQVKEDSESAFSQSQGDRSNADVMAMMQNGNAAEKSLKSDFSVGAIKQNLENIVQQQEISDQIIQQVKVSFTDDMTEMTLQLKPEHLGKVLFSVSTENGALKGSFVAESIAAKEAIEINMIQLKAQLNEQGIKVEEMEVVLGNTDAFLKQKDSQNQQNQTASQRRRRIERIESLETIEEQIQNLKNELSELSVDTQQHSVEFSA